MALQHDGIDYNLDLNTLPAEKWSYLMSAFYQRLPLIICDPVFVTNVKNKINAYKMLIDSPQWFNDNGDFFIGLHLIEFGKFKLMLNNNHYIVDLIDNNILYLNYIKIFNDK